MARTTKAQREAIIQNIFMAVGAEYGYEHVHVRLTARKYFSAKWQRSFNWISFDLSDFVEYAPAGAIRGLAHTLLAKIKGDNRPYGQEFTDHVMSGEFLTQMQPRFIRRNRAVADDRLDDIVAGLDAPKGTAFAVTNSKSHTAITNSTLFRTILVPMYALEDWDADDLRDMIADELTELAYNIEHFGE